jgi:hypothetical protein
VGGVYRQKIRFQIEGLGVYNFVNSGLLRHDRRALGRVVGWELWRKRKSK